ncbi:MAG TPA: xanthine dehydrogenase family protein subunit M [Candidatus Acidoferrum sp.]|nr:xanthine dehydrogenase family protein subunit M [Candidatus Acidoferrum sp.]
MLQPFRVLTPANIEQASAELVRLGERAMIYAGGAELILLLRYGMVHAEYLINIKCINGLDEIRWDGQTVQIGATVTHRRLETDPLIRERLPLLADAESQIANIRVRNQGTLGGNLCFNDPHSDPGTALLLHEAEVILANKDGLRQIPLSDFLSGMYATALEPGELLQKVFVAPLAVEWGAAYLRVHRYQRPTLNVAVATKLQNGTVEDARLAVGCVGPKPQRESELEARIRGEKIDGAKQIFADSKQYLKEKLEPVDDLLGSADYKIYMTAVLLSRALSQAGRSNGRG